jgi:hypothetical protein
MVWGENDKEGKIGNIKNTTIVIGPFLDVPMESQWTTVPKLCVFSNPHPILFMVFCIPQMPEML